MCHLCGVSVVDWAATGRLALFINKRQKALSQERRLLREAKEAKTQERD
jgi:hypothetical protein